MYTCLFVFLIFKRFFIRFSSNRSALQTHQTPSILLVARHEFFTYGARAK